MRLWAWEESNSKQRKKRERLWTAAVICWAAALAMTYWVERSLYGGAIETNTFLLLGGSIGMSIVCCLRRWLGTEDTSPTKKSAWVIGILLVLGMAVFAWIAVGGGTAVYMIQILFILLVLYWSDRERMKDIDRNAMYACTLLFSAVMLTAGTLAGPRLLGYTDTYHAGEQLTAEGFSDVSYVRWMYGRWVHQFAAQKSFYQEEMQEEKYYLFAGEKDGENWCIVVAPKGSDIILAGTDKEEPELANWK